MKKAIFPIVLLLLSWASLSAQLNESDTLRYQLRTTLTGNFQEGNVTFTTVRGKLDFSYKPHPFWVFKTQNSSLYQAFGVKVDNDVFSRNYLYFKADNRVYPFGIAYISTNYRRKIDSRFFAGAGGTWRVIRQKQHELKLSASTVYEETAFNGTTFNYEEFDGKNKLAVWRGTLYMAGTHVLFEKKARFYYDAYWQPAFSNTNDYRTEFDVGLDFTLWKGLSFNVLYTYKHENIVVTKIKTDDKILTFGLAYNFKRR
jgi:hypothetical protein